MGRLRELRKTVLDALAREPWPAGLDDLEALAPRHLAGPLFACLLEPEPLIRWRAAEAFGRTVARLFDDKPEDARQLMRQLMWRLNEESGNIAWGIPETFGEILAVQPVLACEFHRVLCSYINEPDRDTGDNYLELAPLRRGVYWALARLAEDRPALALPALADLLAALEDPDPQTRGLAALAVRRLLPVAGDKTRVVREALDRARGDTATFQFYRRGRLEEAVVGQMAEGGAGPEEGEGNTSGPP